MLGGGDHSIGATLRGISSKALFHLPATLLQHLGHAIVNFSGVLGLAKLGHDDGFLVALAWFACLKSQSQAVAFQ